MARSRWAAAAVALVVAAIFSRARRHRYPPRTLVGRTALVTGGARGLGLLIAEELGARGANLVICSRDAAQLERASARLSARGFNVRALAADLSQAPEAQRVVDSAREAFASVDI